MPETSFVDRLQSRSSRRVTRRARVRGAVECHREDWSSVLQDKNLFSIMSEDTFLVRYRRASGLSELCTTQLFYRLLLWNFIAGCQSELGGYLFVIPPRLLSHLALSQPSPPHQQLSGIISGSFAVMTCVYTPAKNISNKALVAASVCRG